MLCATVKSGVECSFMAKSGCGFLGGACHAVIDKCEGCERVKAFDGQKYCAAFPQPAARWRIGNCSMATHIKKEAPAAASKVRVGQQKQKKR
jgi:hypothetical protein